LKGEEDAYQQFKKTYPILPLEEAEALIAYLNLEKIESSGISQLLLDMEILADRAASHY